jgi:hypothetical protein
MKPQQALVTTRCLDRYPVTYRYPYIESLLQDAALQPYVHDCLVQLRNGNRVHHFIVFFKRHCRLGVNLSLPFLLSDSAGFRGDAVVMRVGVQGRHHSFVNMRSGDAALLRVL